MVDVSDSGTGIAPENHERIFEMFGQLQAEGASPGGQGIGLALTKALIEMHGGSISVYSAWLGHGSTFSVRLPLRVVEAHVPAVPAPASAGAAGARRLRVLIADDSTDIADTVAMLLEDLGHETRVAYDGEQALAMVAAWLPDVALLDLGMPFDHAGRRGGTPFGLVPECEMTRDGGTWRPASQPSPRCGPGSRR